MWGASLNSATQIAASGAFRLRGPSGRLDLLKCQIRFSAQVNQIAESNLSFIHCLARNMTALVFWMISSSLLFSNVHGINIPQCDADGYGQPNFYSCTELIFNTIPTDQGLDRLFSLQTSIKPEDISSSEWSARVALPFLRENGLYPEYDSKAPSANSHSRPL
jgi:hypothetical protein